VGSLGKSGSRMVACGSEPEKGLWCKRKTRPAELDSEINLEISRLWVGGVVIRLGEKVDGFLVDRRSHPLPTSHRGSGKR